MYMAFKQVEQAVSQGHVVGSSKNRYTILCASGEIYKIKRPGGRLATQHFSIMTKAVPTDVTFDIVDVQKFDEDDMAVFMQDADGKDILDEYGNKMPVMVPTKVPVLSPGDLDRIAESFMSWAPVVLPGIIVEGLPYDEMPGEDQYGIFMALFNKMNLDKEIFRFIDDTPVGGTGDGTSTDSQSIDKAT